MRVAASPALRGRAMICTRPARPRSLILLGEAGDLGVERRLGLALDEIGGRDIDEDEQRQHRGREQREIERREAEGVGAAAAAIGRAASPLLGARRR